MVSMAEYSAPTLLRTVLLSKMVGSPSYENEETLQPTPLFQLWMPQRLMLTPKPRKNVDLFGRG
jgi:hypothetical protein